MRSDKIITRARAIQKIKKENFWLRVNKDIVLKQLEENKDKFDEAKRGRKLNVNPWDRNSSQTELCKTWWAYAHSVYMFMELNPSCPKDQLPRVCSRQFGIKQNSTVNSIVKFIELHGNPLNNEEYLQWRLTEGIESSFGKYYEEDPNEN